VVGASVDGVRATHRVHSGWVPKDLPPEPIDWSSVPYRPAPGCAWAAQALGGGGGGGGGRTVVWLLCTRWLRRDAERLCATSEPGISLARRRLLARRLVRLP